MVNQRSSTSGPFVRFLLSGAVNTGLTYLLYLFLLQWMGARLSYSIAFASGIALSYSLGRVFVFRQPAHAGRGRYFPLIYLLQYLLGLLIVHAWVELLGWPPALAALASICLTVPLTFVLSRWVFQAPARSYE